MKSRSLFCLAALVVLPACMPKPVPPPIVDIAAMPCATAMAMSGAMPLLFDPKGRDEKTTTAILDGHSRCIQDSGGGRRLYQVFALPSTDLSYILAVRSSPWADTILAPRVLLLSGDGNIIRSTSHADFVFRGEQLSALMRSHPGEVYLAVTSDSEVLGREITRVVEAVNSSTAALPNGGAFTWYSGSDSTHNMVLSVAGRVEVTVTPFPPDDPKK
jgi:hypothetical protein